MVFLALKYVCVCACMHACMYMQLINCSQVTFVYKHLFFLTVDAMRPPRLFLGGSESRE